MKNRGWWRGERLISVRAAVDEFKIPHRRLLDIIASSRLETIICPCGEVLVRESELLPLLQKDPPRTLVPASLYPFGYLRYYAMTPEELAAIAGIGVEGVLSLVKRGRIIAGKAIGKISPKSLVLFVPIGEKVHGKPRSKDIKDIHGTDEEKDLQKEEGG